MVKIIKLDLDKHFNFLYTLLEERYSVDYINTESSLPKIPDRQEYRKFLEESNMDAWVLEDDELLKAFLFVRDSEVGVFVKKKYQSMGYGTISCEFLNKKYNNVYAKCNPKNKKVLGLMNKFLIKDGDVWRKTRSK